MAGERVSRRTGTMNDITHPNDYEKSDADPRLIAALALGVAAFLVVTPFALLAVYPGADRLGAPPAERPLPPQPRLQVRPKADLDVLRAMERERLISFGWVDRDRKIVRIPIERAMGLLSQRGLADWPLPPATTQK
jgi:hypothetical protein